MLDHSAARESERRMHAMASGDVISPSDGKKDSDERAQQHPGLPRTFTKSPSARMSEDCGSENGGAAPAPAADSPPGGSGRQNNIASSSSSSSSSGPGFVGSLMRQLSKGATFRMRNFERRLSWGYQPSLRRRATAGEALDGAAEDEVGRQSVVFSSSARGGCGGITSWGLTSLLAVLQDKLEETFPNHDEKETRFQESWRDENRATMLRNLGRFALCYLALGTFCVVTVAATAAVAAGTSTSTSTSAITTFGDSRATMRGGGGEEEEETLLMTATQAAWMASLVGFGFVVLVVSFVAFAAAPAGTHPGTLEAIKCVVLVVVIGCVVVTDALPWVSEENREQPELFVAAVALLCCLPPLMESSPAAVVAAAPVVVTVHLGATLVTSAGRRSFARRGAPRVVLIMVAAWLASLHSVRRRRAARRHFTSMTLLSQEERRADWVLGLMLPRMVVQRLKSGSNHCAAMFKEASVLFIEIADFAALSASLSAAELVELLNFVFTTFDDALETFDSSLYKVETVGPVYVVSAGVPEPRPDHCKALTLLALSLCDKLSEALDLRPDLPEVRCKMGLQSGPVVGGVIGITHPRYRLFGDIVNTAARMETRSDPGRIHAAEEAAEILKRTGMFRLTDRGEMAVKGKGTMRTYFVDGLAPGVVDAKLKSLSYGKVLSESRMKQSSTARNRWLKLNAANSFLLLGAQVQKKRRDLEQGMRQLDEEIDFDDTRYGGGAAARDEDDGEESSSDSGQDDQEQVREEVQEEEDDEKDKEDGKMDAGKDVVGPALMPNGIGGDGGGGDGDTGRGGLNGTRERAVGDTSISPNARVLPPLRSGSPHLTSGTLSNGAAFRRANTTVLRGAANSHVGGGGDDDDDDNSFSWAHDRVLHRAFTRTLSVGWATPPRVRAEKEDALQRSTSTPFSSVRYPSFTQSVSDDDGGGGDNSFTVDDDDADRTSELSPEEAAAMRCDARIALEQETSENLLHHHQHHLPGSSSGSARSPAGMGHESLGREDGGGGGGGGGASASAGAHAAVVGGDEPSSPGSTMRSGDDSRAGGGSDPMEQNPWTLQFTQVVTEQEYFALMWGARGVLLRRAVPVSTAVAAAIILWSTVTRLEQQRRDSAWIAVGLTVAAGGWLMAVPLSSFAFDGERRRRTASYAKGTILSRFGKVLFARSYRRVFAQDSVDLRRAASLVQRICQNCNTRLQPVLGVIIVALCGVYSWAAMDAGAGRRAEVHVLVLLSSFAASFVFLCTSATGVTPTIVVVLTIHAVFVFIRGTYGSVALAPAASSSSSHDGDVGGSALSVMGAVALVTTMVCSGSSMCAISRAEDKRSRGNFVREFRRRQQQRRWAALISNMLPLAVVKMLQDKGGDSSNNSNKARSSFRVDTTTTAAPPDIDADAAASAAASPPTMAWNLPHTCVFQSDIVGFTALTQRIAPTQLVAMLHSLFMAYDRVCAKHDVQKIETIGDAYLAATGCTFSPDHHLISNSRGNSVVGLKVEGGERERGGGEEEEVEAEGNNTGGSRTPRDSASSRSHISIIPSVSGESANAGAEADAGDGGGGGGGGMSGRSDSAKQGRTMNGNGDRNGNEDDDSDPVSVFKGYNSDVCRLARMALEVQELMVGYLAPDGGPLTVRVGLHHGETVGGVVGEKMLRYHLFGPTLEGVNRMEQSCEEGGVRCSEAFANILKRDANPNEFNLEPAGDVEMEDGTTRGTYALTFKKRRSRRKRMLNL